MTPDKKPEGNGWIMAVIKGELRPVYYSFGNICEYGRQLSWRRVERWWPMPTEAELERIVEKREEGARRYLSTD